MIDEADEDRHPYEKYFSGIEGKQSTALKNLQKKFERILAESWIVMSKNEQLTSVLGTENPSTSENHNQRLKPGPRSPPLVKYDELAAQKLKPGLKQKLPEEAKDVPAIASSAEEASETGEKQKLEENSENEQKGEVTAAGPEEKNLKQQPAMTVATKSSAETESQTTEEQELEQNSGEEEEEEEADDAINFDESELDEILRGLPDEDEEVEEAADSNVTSHGENKEGEVAIADKSSAGTESQTTEEQEEDEANDAMDIDESELDEILQSLPDEDEEGEEEADSNVTSHGENKEKGEVAVADAQGKRSSQPQTFEEAKAEALRKKRKKTQTIKPRLRAQQSQLKQQPSDSPDPAKFVDYEKYDFWEEMGEIYSYLETNSFKIYREDFETELERCCSKSWHSMTHEDKKQFLEKLVQKLEIGNNQILSTVGSILYLLQGVWNEETLKEAVFENLKTHVFLLYGLGAFQKLTCLLQIEAEKFYASHEFDYRSHLMLVLLNILCTMAEIMRHEKNNPKSPYTRDVKQFCRNLLNTSQEFLIITLLKMVQRFSDCQKKSAEFPIKKTLLLLHKLILLGLGDLTNLKKMKKQKRKDAGLTPDHDEVKRNTDLNAMGKQPKAYKHELIHYVAAVKKNHLQGSSDKELNKNILESIEIVKNHLYTPLGDRQRIEESILGTHEYIVREMVERTPTERLFIEFLPGCGQYVGGLVKILTMLVRKAPKKSYHEEETRFIFKVPSDLFNEVEDRDILRHQEIIMKALSAILLLLMKHFKLNHVYQFEYMVQFLLSHGILTHIKDYLKKYIKNVRVKNEISKLEFPSCVLEASEISKDDIPSSSFDQNIISERNLYISTTLCAIYLKMMKFELRETRQAAQDRIFDLVSVRIDNKKFNECATELIKPLLKFSHGWVTENQHQIWNICKWARPRLIYDNAFSENYISYYRPQSNEVSKFISRRYGFLNMDLPFTVKSCFENFKSTVQPCCDQFFTQWWNNHRLT